MLLKAWSKALGAIAVAAVVYGVIVNIPDIKRYVRMMMM
jgi:hypothetical protein